MKRCAALCRARPVSLARFDADFETIVSCQFVSREDLEPRFAFWDEVGLALKRILSELQDLAPDLQTYLHGMAAELRDAEDALNDLGILYITAIVTRVLVGNISRLSFLLGYSLVLLLAFGTVDRQDILPDLGIPIMFGTVAWTIMTLRELVRTIKRFYRDSATYWHIP